MAPELIEYDRSFFIFFIIIYKYFNFISQDIPYRKLDENSVDYKKRKDQKFSEHNFEKIINYKKADIFSFGMVLLEMASCG